MEGPVIRHGDVVTVKFPYIDDETGFKHRPAFVVATPHPSVSMLCEITTNVMDRPHAISLDAEDFHEGGLRKRSVIRTDVIVTMHHNRIKERVGAVTEQKLQEVLGAINRILHGPVN